MRHDDIVVDKWSTEVCEGIRALDEARNKKTREQLCHAWQRQMRRIDGTAGKVPGRDKIRRGKEHFIEGCFVEGTT